MKHRLVSCASLLLAAAAMAVAGGGLAPAHDGVGLSLALRGGSLSPARATLLRFRTLDVDTADIPKQLAADFATPAGDGLWIVQFEPPLDVHETVALAHVGVTRLAAVPNSALLIRFDGDAETLRQLPGVTWVGAYPRSLRIDSALFSGAGSEVVGATVELDAGRNVDLLCYGIGVVATPVVIDGRRLVRVEARRAALRRLATVDGVIHARLHQEFALLDERADQVVAGVLSPDGTGPSTPGYLEFLASRGVSSRLDFAVDVTDSGFDRGSIDETPGDLLGTNGLSRIMYLNNFTTDLLVDDRGGHGTINVSILGGSSSAVDDRGYGLGTGVAPASAVGVTKIFSNVGVFDATATFSEIVAAAYGAGARISSNSWGSFANDYTLEAQEYDARTRDALPDEPGAQQMLFVFAAGNFGTGGTVASPATAKNVIAVGASEGSRPGDVRDGCGLGRSAADSAQDIVYFSGSGPTYDGRAKPDLVAPGSHIVGLASRADGFSGRSVCGVPGEIYYPAGQNVYTWSSGTSHATPIVAGGAALVRQRLLETGFDDPSPALVKAWLLNTTRYLVGQRAGDDLPGSRQGWGMMDLGRALDDTERILVDQGTVFDQSGLSWTATGEIASSDRPFRVTLTWTDPPGSSAFAPLVNDLDVELVIAGRRYRANSFEADVSQPDGEREDRDNVEQIWLPAGVSGPFAVRVSAVTLRGDGVPGNGDPTDQDFALVIYNGRELPLTVFEARGVTINEAATADGDGFVEPGEEFTVDPAIANAGDGPRSQVTARLTTSSADVEVLEGVAVYDDLLPGVTVAPKQPFRCRLEREALCGGRLEFGLELETGASPDRHVVAGISGKLAEATAFADSFEAGVGGWRHKAVIGKDRWKLRTDRAYEGNYAWYCKNKSHESDARLDSPSIDIPVEAVAVRLEFFHTWSFEPGGWDGAVLEVVAGGKATDLGPYITVGGYNGVISGDFFNPLGGRKGWIDGRLGMFVPVVVDLSPWRGQTVTVRFRMATDEVGYGPGWYVDDVRVVTTYASCGEVSSVTSP